MAPGAIRFRVPEGVQSENGSAAEFAMPPNTAMDQAHANSSGATAPRGVGATLKSSNAEAYDEFGGRSL